MMFFAIIFCSLYVFFRYIHPVVPWDGDDWATAGTFILSTEYAFPRIGYVQSCRFFSKFLGTLAGSFAGYVIYPITGDYVNSFVITNALSLSICITLVAFSVFTLLQKYTNHGLVTYIGILTFLILSFTIFKAGNTTSGVSTYLWWQYNQCTTYWYSIPGYLASVFVIFLICNDILDRKEIVNIKVGCILLALYCLTFSFLPAAIFISVISFVLILTKIRMLSDIQDFIRECFLYFVSIILSVVNLFFEIRDVFSTGYFAAPSDIGLKLRTSFMGICSAFIKINPLVIFLSVFAVIVALFILYKRKHRKQDDEFDKKFFKVFCILILSLFFLFVFFTSFGVISLNHIVRGNLPIRIDTMYGFFFLLILLVVWCSSYILEKINIAFLIYPICLFVLFYTMINPLHSYSDSIYDDTTPNQRYEIMSLIIDEIKNRDESGISSMIVYMPRYGHYGTTLPKILYQHNIINNPFNIQFEYDERIKTIGEIYFE